MIGITIFAIVGLYLSSVITGTDSGSNLLQTVLLTVLAAVILIGVVSSMGGGK